MNSIEKRQKMILLLVVNVNFLTIEKLKVKVLLPYEDCTLRHDNNGSTTGPVCPIDFNEEDYPKLIKKI